MRIFSLALLSWLRNMYLANIWIFKYIWKFIKKIILLYTYLFDFKTTKMFGLLFVYFQVCYIVNIAIYLTIWRYVDKCIHSAYIGEIWGRKYIRIFICQRKVIFATHCKKSLAPIDQHIPNYRFLFPNYIIGLKVMAT